MLTALVVYVSVVVGLGVGAMITDLSESKHRAQKEFDKYWAEKQETERRQGLQVCWRLGLTQQDGESEKDFISRGRLAAFLAEHKWGAIEK